MIDSLVFNRPFKDFMMLFSVNCAQEFCISCLPMRLATGAWTGDSLLFLLSFFGWAGTVPSPRQKRKILQPYLLLPARQSSPSDWQMRETSSLAVNARALALGWGCGPWAGGLVEMQVGGLGCSSARVKPVWVAPMGEGGSSRFRTGPTY